MSCLTAWFVENAFPSKAVTLVCRGSQSRSIAYMSSSRDRECEFQNTKTAVVGCLCVGLFFACTFHVGKQRSVGPLKLWSFEFCLPGFLCDVFRGLYNAMFGI